MGRVRILKMRKSHSIEYQLFSIIVFQNLAELCPCRGNGGIAHGIFHTLTLLWLRSRNSKKKRERFTCLSKQKHFSWTASDTYTSPESWKSVSSSQELPSTRVRTPKASHMLCSAAMQPVHTTRKNMASWYKKIGIALKIRKAKLPPNDLEYANTSSNQRLLLHAMGRYDEAPAT